MKRNRKSQARRKPAPPKAFNGDHGTGTAAATAGTIIEPVKGEEHNMSGARRRMPAIEVYHKRGFLSREQLGMCLDLQAAFEATFKSPPAIKKVQVDSSPKPDHAIEMQLSRIDKFRKAYSAVPPDLADEVDAIVLRDVPVERPNSGYYDCAIKLSKLLVAMDFMQEYVDD